MEDYYMVEEIAWGAERGKTFHLCLTSFCEISQDLVCWFLFCLVGCVLFWFVLVCFVFGMVLWIFCTQLVPVSFHVSNSWPTMLRARSAMQEKKKNFGKLQGGFTFGRRGLKGAWGGFHLRKASKGLEGGFNGASRGLEGGLKPSALKGASRRLEGGLKGASPSEGFKGAWRGLQGSLKGAWTFRRWSGLRRGFKAAWRGLHLQKAWRRFWYAMDCFGTYFTHAQT